MAAAATSTPGADAASPAPPAEGLAAAQGVGLRATRPLVLATPVRLLNTTWLRIGITEYARRHHSFGLSTLRNRHAGFSGNTLQLSFVGKSGVRHQAQARRLPLHACCGRAYRWRAADLHRIEARPTMSDPQPVPGRKSPPRAKPLQPDNPARGLGQQPADAATSKRSDADRTAKETAAKQAKTSQTALENVRQGYD